MLPNDESRIQELTQGTLEIPVSGDIKIYIKMSRATYFIHQPVFQANKIKSCH